MEKQGYCGSIQLLILIQIKEDIVDKVLTLRKEYQLGSWKIKWYLERYHDIHISKSCVTKILKRYGVEENFNNFERPHGAHKGKTPYETLKDR